MKLCDFGLSQRLGKNGKLELTKKIGTIGYMAPELGQAETVDQAIDMWSVGIMFYEMTVGYKPTAVKGFKYGSGPIPFATGDWRRKSKALQNLISACLEMDPSKRPKAAEALAHPWFNE